MTPKNLETKRSGRHQRKLAALVGVSLATSLVLAFQNCAPGFEVLNHDVASLGEAPSEIIPVEDVPVDPNANLSVYVRNTTATLGGDLVFKVELNKVSSTPVTIQLKTVPGTALPFVDYQDLTTSVSIPAGQLSADVSVKSILLKANTVNKTMTLEALSTSAGTIAQKVGVATIKASHRVENFKQVEGGFAHTCGITTQDTVKCWGSNRNGELGNGTTVDSSIPVDVKGLTDVKQISSAYAHTCVITAQDTVKCWGGNSNGQLGNKTTTNSSLPIDVIGLTGIKQIATGTFHTCAITAQDTMKCWGNNGGGQLGDGTISDSSMPIDVTVIGNSRIKQISTGYRHTCAITLQGTVHCWGSNVLVPLVDVTELKGIKQISSGVNHTCAITAQDTVKCWGANSDGQLGNNSTSNSTSIVDVKGLVGIQQISSGDNHTCAITAQGSIKCWGDNGGGQLGQASSSDHLLPVDLPTLTGVKRISSGSRHTCAVTAQDSVKCWGNNNLGQIGNSTFASTTVPVDMTELTGTKQLSPGHNHACAITAQDTVKCWGYNFYGSLGNGTTTDSSVPVEVTGLSGIKQIASSEYQTCAITAQDTVKCWGLGYVDPLNSGPTVFSSRPVDVPGLKGVKQISSGGGETCAVTAQNTVKCWSSYNPAPTDIAGLAGIKKISSGSGHTCAITAQDTVKCWGYNNYGQLGNGSTTAYSVRTEPVDVTDLTGIKQISSGYQHSCAVTAQDTVKCWGMNRKGQLGNGLNADSSVPVDVSIADLSRIKQISTGLEHTCAITEQDAVKCWGNNYFGQLGHAPNSSSPMSAVRLNGIKQVSLGGDSTYVQTVDLRVRRFGAFETRVTVPSEVTSPIP